MTLLSIFIILFIGFIVLLAMYAIKNIRKSKLAVSSTIDLCDTNKAIREWCDKNQYRSFCNPEFQKLLKSHIKVYINWKHYHPDHNDNGYIDYLDSYVV